MVDSKNLQKQDASVLQNEEESNLSQEKPSFQMVQEVHSGPLPSPKILAKYNDIVPTAAERIISMAEKEQKHRHSIITLHSIMGVSGQIFAFLLFVLALCAGVFLLIRGINIAGFITLIGTLGTAVTIFLIDRKKETSDSEQQLELDL